MPTNLLTKPEAALLADAAHAELYASSLYKHVANQMQRVGYLGAAKWFLKESADELEHYQGIADFANDMGSVIAIPTVEGHTDKLKTLRAALELAYDTELQLMRDYSRWYGQAEPVTQQFLLRYLEIQRKSVGEYGDWLARLDRVGADECGILLIDQELGA